MTKQYILPITFSLALICILYPWVTIQGHYMVNGNISWLLMAAERLLNGQDIITHIYETNPPLSILIYIPHVLFSHIAGLPLTIGAFYTTSALVILSAFAVYNIIKKFDFLNETEKATFILAYLIATTLATGVFFSDREHFIILALVPFVLCQFALTQNIKIESKLLWLVLIIGSMCVLIKPHYGIVPTIFLLHRLANRKNFKIITDPDFLLLAVTTLSYIGVTLIFFQDYVITILPDALKLYVKNGHNLTNILNATRIQLILYLSIFLFELFREDLKKQQKHLLIYLYLSCLLCMIPYYVQLKGFYNHLVPAHGFFLISCALSAGFRSKNIAALIIPMVLLACLVKLFTPLSTSFPKQSDVPHLPLAEFLEKNCKKPCTFYAFHGDIEIINPTAARMGYTHASRFPSLWFLPEILKNPEKYKDLREKYTSYVAQDLAYYKPSIILLTKDLPVANQTINFLEYFGQNGQIRSVFKNYQKVDDFGFDRTAYFRGTTLDASHIYKYDVYKLVLKDKNP